MTSRTWGTLFRWLAPVVLLVGLLGLAVLVRDQMRRDRDQQVSSDKTQPPKRDDKLKLGVDREREVPLAQRPEWIETFSPTQTRVSDLMKLVAVGPTAAQRGAVESERNDLAAGPNRFR